jgi:asparagine synthase (glutamine-hydrolysing)
LSRSEAPATPGYLVVLWPAGHGEPAAVLRIRKALGEHAPQLESRFALPGLCLFADRTSGGHPVSADEDARLILVGAAFDRDTLEEGGASQVDAGSVVRLDDPALLARVWGHFIALRRQPEHAGVTILRDASGGLGAFVTEGEGVLLVSPNLPEWLRRAAGARPMIDAQWLAAALANPLLPTHRSLLKGVRHLPAGCALDCVGTGSADIRTLWPQPHLLREPPAIEAEASTRLRKTVAGCARALASLHPRLTLELSGGLDSAIVLGAIATAPDPVEVSCVNFAVAHAGGDERSQARAVADQWGVRLVEVTTHASDLQFADLFTGEQPVEPMLYGLDPILERASIGVARAFDSTAIFTGQGGDAVFGNLPSPLVAVDYAHAVGWRAHFSKVVYDAARRAHRSIWHVQWLMLRNRLWRHPPPAQPMPGMQLGSAAIAAARSRVLRHPWLRDDAVMAPARRLQFEAIANCQHFNSPTWRSAEKVLIHPLLSQPVVEACLAIPSYRLASGAGDRAFAREVFRDWLPPPVRDRRDKGDATNYYRRAVSENLAWLRAFLLDGTLVAHGFLDGPGIDQALREENLIWSDTSRLVVVYASFEAWARYWGLEYPAD